MLIVDAILYFLLALYFDAVIPAEYGPRKPPHFIFMPSFWKSLFNTEGKKKAQAARQMSARVQEASDDVEAMPAEMRGSEVIRYKIKCYCNVEQIFEYSQTFHKLQTKMSSFFVCL